MHPIALLGWFGAALSIALPWPQVWRSCVRGRTTGLSVAACWMGVAMPAAWVTYGLLIGETVQVVTNVVTGSASLGVLTAVLIKNREGRTARTMIRSAAGAAGIVATTLISAGVAALTSVTGTQAAAVLGSVLAVASLISAVPQPLSLLRDRTQDMSGLSPLRWRLAAAACGSWMTYGLFTGQPAVWASAMVGLTSALIVCTVLAGAQRTARAAERTARAASRPAVARPAAVRPTVARAAAVRPVVARAAAVRPVVARAAVPARGVARVAHA
ncbi:SemiSWEET transporter [Actinoplanes sp. RD1]|uniref:SemiSWEET transporter n=1 Tax=Actinoplanes sp. RD1 TaxID=3064538 RepID=UPI0027429B18|nr:SemiSWEET transporter [Actinoplanes sp. RD1]